MFDHPLFDKYSFQEIPLDRDIYLMDEMWLEEYERSLVGIFEGRGRASESVGYISYAAARSVDETNANLSWYPNVFDRFHEVHITLPRDQFIACVGCWRYDEKPHIFVRSGWLEHLYLRFHSIFALIDAIGVKRALKEGLLTRERLIQLRNRIDALAEQSTDILFISFADSLLLKSNWYVGRYDSDTKSRYDPERFIRLISEIKDAYREVLGLSIYAVLTQGVNAYYEDPVSHISTAKNHISLNSLGLPFAQLMSIEKAARTAIHENVHGSAEIYMDATFFRSLRFVFEFEKNSCSHNAYCEPLTGGRGTYFFANCDLILRNLRKPNSGEL